MSWILFFDGDCAFCSRSCRWIARHDKRERIKLAPLQGRLGQELGLQTFVEGSNGTMVVLREADQQRLFRSDALIELGSALGGVYRLASVLRLIPRPLRDGVYSLIARNRHLLMRGSSSCLLQDPEVEKRLKQ
jgi:predicted DCC family thiol-disulfide oxidoreductase YuxK